ncbi:MAG: chemotaxis response regulator protein-glutamate methylesterase, partial [candidate division Zixibacteria bacterium]|nr:chemotaxis response regulator protein-glutamate methylesterase [Gammaproteobacteria bacterium]NIR48470.1 chemotaxis response regulator protein-glutamate methylesterase [candidate division KSB1 bacterium]NIR63828.1 chemotaxis response regulator protein-glutamate methylesterase [candidate division Zixibacteria bacterium]NIS45790.1 chemotaxis response regulator protein-glutamate methylesterase [candidate division Zixibacteria bacterium]NIT70945.1 chemotaxis response regulator protein-glutamate 
MSTKTVKVLIVDDSALIRKLLTELISSDPGLEVIGAARDPY